MLLLLRLIQSMFATPHPNVRWPKILCSISRKQSKPCGPSISPFLLQSSWMHQENATRLANLAQKYPDIIFLDCYAHQVRHIPILTFVILTPEHQINLIVGNYFKSEASVLDFTDDATELITWLWSKTQVLTLLREVQARLGKNTVKAVIRAVLT